MQVTEGLWSSGSSQAEVVKETGLFVPQKRGVGAAGRWGMFLPLRKGCLVVTDLKVHLHTGQEQFKYRKK